MKRVMHLLASDSYSGAEQVAVNIIRGLGDTFSMAYASPDGPIRESLRAQDINFIPLQGLNVHAIRSAISEFKPDLIHAHDYRASFYAAILAGKVPVISHLHCNWPWSKKINLKTLAYSGLLYRFAKVLLVSDAILKEFVFGSLLSKKAVVVPNVVNTAKLLKIQETGEASDLLFVGRLVPEKDPLAFIELVSAVKQIVPEVKALMLGSGILESECRQRIGEQGLEANLQLLGFVTNPYKFMKSAKVLVTPSRWEGFGLVVLEAMILGTPVLCTPVGGLVNLVKDGENGFICSSPAELQARALSLIQNQMLRNQFSANAARHGAQISDFQSFCNRVGKIYLDTLED